ncbi:hypothetical protein [Micromonospora sp. NPDC092111]|uniref:hypothetical protein n=1 Tax=Micromonospora sp. NPDC092111 TaxID=3364289 RepID=UPI0038001655
MHLIRRLYRWLTGRQLSPPPGTGRRIQAREQAAARDRLIAQAHRRNTAEYRYSRPIR